MFKPHYSYCKFCDKDDQLIVVKSGHCQKCNHDQKQAKKKASGRSVAKKTFVSTASGEGEMFRSLALESLGDDYTKCFVCGMPIAALTYSNMAHVLSKKQFPAFRLNPDNIVILCHRLVADENGRNGCHNQIDGRPRSEIQDDPRWQKFFELEEQLKEQYKNLNDE